MLSGRLGPVPRPSRIQKATKDTSASGHSGTREQLIDAAAEMFSERGYGGTTVRDLSMRVGLTSGSVFHYFDSKEALFLEVVRQGLVSTVRHVEEEAGDATDPSERLRGMIRGHLRALLESDATPTTVVFHEWWWISPDTAAILVSLRDDYERMWDRALRDVPGVPRTAKERRVLRLLLLGAMNSTVNWYRPNRGLGIDDLANTLFDRFLPQA